MVAFTEAEVSLVQFSVTNVRRRGGQEAKCSVEVWLDMKHAVLNHAHLLKNRLNKAATGGALDVGNPFSDVSIRSLFRKVLHAVGVEGTC